jgi:hypothetical protein
VLELAEEALDEIALAIDAPVYRTVYQALAGRRDMGFGAAGSDQIEQCVGVIASVGDHMTAFEAAQQERCCTQIVVFAGGQHEPYRQAILID